MPFLAGRDPSGRRIEPLGSVTNQTFRVTYGEESYVVRIAGPTTRYLDRGMEAHNARIAADLELTPPILFLDERLLVTRFIPGARPLTAAAMNDPQTLLLVAGALRRLQRSDRPFLGERHPFGEIDRYLAQHTHPRGLALRQAARPVEAALARSPRPPVPAHIDASPANFLVGEEGRLWLVDWEFSAMADPAWDPASVLMQRTIREDGAERRFVAAIHGAADDGSMARIGLFEAALCLVAGSWCAMEASSRGNAALMQMAESYFDRGEAFLSDPTLQCWLQAL